MERQGGARGGVFGSGVCRSWLGLWGTSALLWSMGISVLLWSRGIWDAVWLKDNDDLRAGVWALWK